MNPVNRRAVLLLSSLVMFGCSREPSLSISQIEGVYGSSPCPPIVLKGNKISAGSESHSFTLTNIKGDNILHTEVSPFFVEQEGRCAVVFRPAERYIFIKKGSEMLSLEILSEDLTLSRNFQKR